MKKMKNWITPVLLCVPSILSAKQERLPNIVFILADDMGYGDVSYLNNQGKIKTPNLDYLANRGVVFTDAHSNASVSTPTRYGVLTGRYSWRSTLKQGVLKPYESPIITSDRMTLPKMLKKKGYNTACIGKWHLGWNWPTIDDKVPIDQKEISNIAFDKEINGGPCDIGFDCFFGVDAPNYPPYTFIRNRNLEKEVDIYRDVNLNLDTRGGSCQQNWDLKKVLPILENEAIAYIDSVSKENKPFFLYLPLTSPHTPIVPDDDWIGKSGLNYYADFVMQTDKVVGSVVNALKRNGVLDNTVLVFTSDNGCSPKADFDLLTKKGHNPSYIFRGMKSDLFEGGHHVPCIVYADRFSHRLVDQTICLTDFMATFATLVGYPITDDEAEDSYNILPLLETDFKGEIREATVHHSVDGSFAIRKGPWKLLLTSTSGGWSEPKENFSKSTGCQLYNLDTDPKETTDISLIYPEIVKELREILKRYICEGRSTPGLPQKNDGESFWKQLEWMKIE